MPTLFGHLFTHTTASKLRNWNAPKTMADFFDTKAYPGKRGMRKNPKVTLEFALIADGVPTDQVYDVLSTEEGVARAFAKAGYDQR